MQNIHEGQCGLCAFFGQHNMQDQQVLDRIHQQAQAPEDLLEDCEHPQHAGLRLKVTPISGCDGFQPALVSAQAPTI